MSAQQMLKKTEEDEQVLFLQVEKWKHEFPKLQMFKYSVIA